MQGQHHPRRCRARRDQIALSRRSSAGTLGRDCGKDQLSRRSTGHPTGHVRIDTARVGVCAGAVISTDVATTHQNGGRAKPTKGLRSLRRAAIPLLPFLSRANGGESFAYGGAGRFDVRTVCIVNQFNVGTISRIICHRWLRVRPVAGIPRANAGRGMPSRIEPAPCACASSR